MGLLTFWTNSAGWSGVADIDTVCRSGPTTATYGTQICEQKVDQTIVITA